MEEAATNVIAQATEQLPFFYEHFDAIITVLITIRNHISRELVSVEDE